MPKVNKKQLIVIWVIWILAMLSILFPITAIIDYEFGSGFKNYRFVEVAAILIIGSLSLYVLRDKKKMFIRPYMTIDLINILLAWLSTLMLFFRNSKFIHNNILLSNLLLCLSFIIFVITIFFAIFRLIKSKKLENKTYTRFYSWMVIITSSLGISYIVLANLIIHQIRASF